MFVLLLLTVLWLTIGTAYLAMALPTDTTMRLASESKEKFSKQMVKKVREFTTEGGAFAKALLLCKGDQEQNRKLDELLCPMLYEMREDFNKIFDGQQIVEENVIGAQKREEDGTLVNGGVQRETFQGLLETMLLDRMNQIAREVKQSVANLMRQQKNIEGLKKPVVMKRPPIALFHWEELYELKSYLMVELGNVKKAVAEPSKNRDPTAPLDKSALASVHSCLITLEQMYTFLAAHPGLSPDEKLTWTLAEFGVSIWTMAALGVHPELEQIALGTDKWIAFCVPTIDVEC